MKRFVIPIVAAVLALTAAACSPLDVVQKDAARAFDEIVDAYGVSRDEQQVWWTLWSPDGDAVFMYANGDMSLEVNAAPFVAAGLDGSKIEYYSDNIVYFDEALYFDFPSWDMMGRNVKETASAQFAADLPFVRKNLGYHDAMGHYNLSFPDVYGKNYGVAMFEWAKDLSANDKDVVFVLDPAPLIAAGVDPNHVDGWAFAEVTMDIDGKSTEVDKFLKPFDIR